MKQAYFPLMALLALLTFAACSSDEDFYYSDVARIRLVGPEIWTNGSDSLTFTFVSYSSETTEMSFDIDAQIMGYTASYDRTTIISVDESLTTATSDQYTVPTEVTIQADSAKASFPVVLKRDDSLTETTVRLYIKVEASDDFEVGVNEENHLTLIWTDQISKPTNWDDELVEFFGTYSDTKYRFMLEITGGMVEFGADTMTWAELWSYRVMFQNALDEYNAAHPDDPLTDENGNLVSFNS